MDLFELLVKNTSSFEEHLLELDSHKAWQLMTAMLLTIEAQELVDSSNSEKLLQQKTAVSINGYNNVLLICLQILGG